jgi:hypothetical protein
MLFATSRSTATGESETGGTVPVHRLSPHITVKADTTKNASAAEVEAVLPPFKVDLIPRR